ncbi:hypothetical protein [Allonocardiopsis opalescens]|uniref:Uncharacterized protein n=1 Tax=Allonocardiopsis opalescens TaxID=1144618 RepID=A0A2T0Q0M4_9ACTN|nr:hypothetical protein [Allonocardiopsis opalescens]PRX97347.1 hypothetical protein CLV72_106384 [Allonocardiopsis opalescens]
MTAHSTAASAPSAPTVRPAPPDAVRGAAAAWFFAVGAGVAEAAVFATDALAAGAPAAGLAMGAGVRAVVYAAVIALVLAMRAGRNPARIALALLLGTVGTLSLVLEPIGWLAAGNSVPELLASADAVFYLSAALRTAHILAVPVGLALMFTPAANAYFRRPR